MVANLLTLFELTGENKSTVVGKGLGIVDQSAMGSTSGNLSGAADELPSVETVADFFWPALCFAIHHPPTATEVP